MAQALGADHALICLSAGDPPYHWHDHAVESLHMTLRQVIQMRGSFPSEEAAMKLLYLAQALNRFALFWEARFPESAF